MSHGGLELSEKREEHIDQQVGSYEYKDRKPSATKQNVI